jgi:hypothetical protein
MAINTREQLKAWFTPSFKLISDRFESIFDSFFHKEDDIYCVDITAADQAGDYSVTKEHDLAATNLLVIAEDKDGKPNMGMEYQNVYVDDVCNSTIVFYSDTIAGTEKLNILKLK